MKDRRRRRILRAAAAGILCIGMITGCAYGNSSGNEEEQGAHPGKKQKVTMIAKSMGSAFWESVYAGASAASTEYHMELVFEGPDSEEDYELQNQMIEQAVEAGTDALVFSAADYEGNAKAVNDAAKAGVRIIVIDSDVNSDQADCRIGSNNYEAGVIAGKAALQSKEPVLNIGIVNFDMATENGQRREEGFRDAVKKDDRAVIIESIHVRSSAAVAREETKKMLRKYPKINVLVTFNEWTSLGVGNAVRELGIADTTTVVAFDSNVASVDMLETGEVDALIVQNPYAMGYLSVETAYKILNGKEAISEVIDTDVKLVTKENMYSDECQRILFSFGEMR